jgi:hypothetical protein
MCMSCEALMINGVYCHESGCPDRDLDSMGKFAPVKCKWCGQTFVPEEKGQRFCDADCYGAYYC